MGEHAIGCRIGEIHGRGQLFVLDDDRLDPVARGLPALGDDDRDAVAREARFADRERPVRRVLHVGRHRPRARERRLPIGLEILTREHRDDAGHRQRGGGVDRDDARVGVRAAHELDVQRARHHEVVDEARFPVSSGGSSRRNCRVPMTGVIGPPPRGLPARCCGSRCSDRGSPRGRAARRARWDRRSPRGTTPRPSPCPPCRSRTGARGSP